MKPLKETDGVWLPAKVLAKKGLTTIKKMYLCKISQLENDNGCNASNGYFSRLFGIDPRTVRKHLHELEKDAWINIYFDPKRKIFLTDEADKFIELGEEQKFQGGTKVGRNKSSTHEELKFHPSRNKSSTHEEQKFHQEDDISIDISSIDSKIEKNQNFSSPDFSKEKQLEKVAPDRQHGKEFVAFCELYGVAHNRINRPLMEAWKDAGVSEWGEILKHLPVYLENTDKQFQRNPLNYLEKFEWINNPNPISRKEKQAPKTSMGYERDLDW